jgi:hypothetical protein
MTETITCANCGTEACISDDPHAWDGWMIVPEKICPECIEILYPEKEE